MSRVVVRLAAGILACSTVAVLAACGDDATGTTPPAPTAPTSPTITSSPPTTSPTTTEPTELPGVTGQLIITRQRDLIDRGFINVQFQTPAAMTITERRLVSDLFDTEAAAPRTSAIPAGRPIHLQLPYGTTIDCDRDAAVEARLTYTYTSDEQVRPATAQVALTGTELLDDIRAKQCTQRRFDAAVDATFSAPVLDGEQIDVDLVLSPTGDRSVTAIDVGPGVGTILVDAEHVGDTVTVDPAAGATIPIRFAVIRCDTHAMAEVTKRYGLQLRVSLDGAPPRNVDIDVTQLLDAFATIVANCRSRTG